MKFKKKRKRFLAGVLAVIFLCSTFLLNLPPLMVKASTVKMVNNIWSGGPLRLYQKDRKYLYRMQINNPESGRDVDVFCIFQFGDMFNGNTVDGKAYNINDPLPDCIKNRGDFERFALIYDWYDRMGGATNVRYAAAQVSIWGIINRSWNLNDPEITAAANHLGGNDFLTAFEEVKTYVDDRYSGGAGLKTIPDWCSMTQELAPPQNMTLINGSYQLELDISAYPDLATENWIMPEGQSGWFKTVVGNKLIFTYSGGGSPLGVIKVKAPPSIAFNAANSSTLTIYLPDAAKDQPMASGAAPSDLIYINIGGSLPPVSSGGGDVTLEIFRHTETFESNYNIDLEKYCAETGKELEGSTFEVLESFSDGQLGDGTNGSIAEENMSPSPTTWSGFRVCEEVRTDSSGHASHSDYREYEYSKTYCGGHPEPDYVECDHDADEDCGCDEENERLRAEWEALCALCEAETDFHSVDDGAAEQMMLSDRDDTYDNFITLEYQYTVKEKTARAGYILHGKHNDDDSIETITTDASEAGANSRSGKNAGEDLVKSSDHTYRVMPGMNRIWKPLELLLPAPETMPVIDLDDVREVIGLDKTELNESEMNESETEANKETEAETSKPKDIPAASLSSASSPSKKPESPKFEPQTKETEAVKNTEADPATPADADRRVKPSAAPASPGNAAEDTSDVDYDSEDTLEEQELVNDLWSAEDYSYTLYEKVSADDREYMNIESEFVFARESSLDRSNDDDDISVSVSLPSPQDDSIDPLGSGDSGNLSHTFQVYDHRTEGELHINKRDLELYRKDPDDSYGKTQADATLEGAVYGLYASEDIIHPDGKTGKVFTRNDLVSIAATDKNGDASFLVITEESDTSKAAPNLNHTWTGHPLILGGYYVKEIARSEGYELSVNGVDLPETNHKSPGATGMADSGTVSVGGLYNETDNFDGSWNEFQVSSYKTVNGYDIIISGYPKDSQFFRVDKEEEEITEEALISKSYQEKNDADGNVVYQTAKGGEYKQDANGNYIAIPDSFSTIPVYRTYYTYYRLKGYPSGTAAPTNPAKWNNTTNVDAAYVADEATKMLSQLGYYGLNQTDGNGAPWQEITLSGTTNRVLVTSLLDWFAGNDFWDSGAVHSVYQRDGQWKALIFHDYKGLNANAVYDAKNGDLYIRKDMEVVGGASASHMFMKYSTGDFIINGSLSKAPDRLIQSPVPFGYDLSALIKPSYEPLYETYLQGELILDGNGNKIPEMEWVYTYGDVTEIYTKNVYVPVASDYNEETGEYKIHVENTTNWVGVTDAKTTVFRAVTKEKSIEYGGEIKAYADYLIEDAGAGVSVYAASRSLAAGSYIKFQALTYPGQSKVYQDAGTRLKPILVMQRIIKQSIKVTKDIAQESYDNVNTYKIHRDPFTVLFGGYAGTDGTKTLKGFCFRIYLQQDLVDTGMLEKKEDGTWDYWEFFENRQDTAASLALSWDKPDKDIDGNLTTIHASQGTGTDDYWGTSIPLPYGTYVIEEVQPEEIPNKHYKKDYPKEVVLPFVPLVDVDGTVHENVESTEYLYDYKLTPEQLTDRYNIRFNEETDEIQAHNNDGDFKVFKYGLEPDSIKDCGNAAVEKYYKYSSVSEDAGKADGIYYKTYFDRDGNTADYGITLDNVNTMSGKKTAIDRKYAPALVPWSVLEPISNGGSADRAPGLDALGDYNFIAYLLEDFENIFYSSKIRIEKLDAETGENIIHDGALFKIYAAKRDITGIGSTGVSGTGKVIFDSSGIPAYDENELIKMEDKNGNEVGIFKAFSTVREVVINGKIEKQTVGYIETYQPLGAGVYVLVEVQAPAGYTKSKPIAFEVYSDKVTYYEEGDPGRPVEAIRYQYAIPVAVDNKFPKYDVHQIKVNDYPSHMAIHKVEDGDQSVGDANGLAGLTDVTDKGDLITYMLRGRKEYLEARGDVKNITWDPNKKEYFGTVTKDYDEWSETVIRGTEEDLKAKGNVKLLYEMDGTFSGQGIIFDIYVKESGLSLYKGLSVERELDGTYKGIAAEQDGEGNITGIIASETGSHLEITTKEKDTGAAHLDIWDTEEIKNPPTNVYFYDLETTPTEADEATGELYVLDSSGNRLCMADPKTGMAYVYDDYNRLIVYPVGDDGKKQLIQSIVVHKDEGDENSDHIYTDIDTADDENGLPIYYKDGHITSRDETWTTDEEPHRIARLPFGAYILEEHAVPYDQGYIQSEYIGFVFHDKTEEQDFFLQNVFTKINIAKIDVTTKEEIRDTVMTLYYADYIEDTDAPQGYRLETAKNEDGTPKIWSTWVSGYEYDDNGKQILAGGTGKVTTKPHWIDHIPVGYYILEESSVPYEWGYVQSSPVEVHVLETGEVQTFVMEDDYTSLDIRKFDTKTDKVIDSGNPASLTLYKATLDAAGKLVIVNGKPQYNEADLILKWKTEDGKAVAGTGREVTDEYGDTFIHYDYDYKKIDTTLRGRYYITETGSTRMEYLPVGQYVLVEEKAPVGYATADPMLIICEEKGHLTEVQKYEMGDVPLTLDLSKVNISGGKIVNGAELEIYPVIGGVPAAVPTYSWISGKDGSYTQADQDADRIPAGFQKGDLKPHRIEYIPVGKYVLVEKTTPFGFLKSLDIPFTVKDTREIQKLEMKDPIPEGIVDLLKHEEGDKAHVLKGAKFKFKNITLNKDIETLVTGEDGRVKSSKVPIGYMDNAGNFKPYTYTITETEAPKDYILNTVPYELQFTYKNEVTPLITYPYDASNKRNQAKVDKLITGTNIPVVGAELIVTGKYKKNLVDRWITNGQTHYLNDLEPGEYILTELKTPGAGYGQAAPVEFTIEETMTEIKYVKMYDDATNVEIHKTSGNSGSLLPGARMQLLKAGGKVVAEWTSEDKPYNVYGLEPGIYILQELEAPDGYKIGSPMTITVNGTYDVQIIKYANDKKSSGGGGNLPEPKPDYVSIIKYSNDGSRLADAEITIYRSDGTVYLVAAVGPNGAAMFKKPPAGTYTFRETRAPEGFYLNPEIFSFSVTASGKVTGDYKIVDLPKQSIPILKADINTKKGIAGSVIAVMDEYNQELARGETGEDGIWKFEIPEPGIYHLREIAAPPSYRLNDTIYEFILNTDGSVAGTTTIYDYEGDGPVKKIGKITAVYKTNLTGKGAADFGKTGKRSAGARTGDDTPIELYAGIALLSALGVIYMILKKRKNGMFMIMLILGMGMSGINPKPAYAQQEYTEEIVYQTDDPENDKGEYEFKEIISVDGKTYQIYSLDRILIEDAKDKENISVVCPAYVPTEESPPTPDLYYTDDTTGRVYRLKQWKLIDTMVEERTQEVINTIDYFEVEQLDKIPEAAPVEVKDGDTGQPVESILPLQEYEYSNDRWKDGFEFQITVEGWDAEHYSLGNQVVPREAVEENLFQYDGQLLGLIGASPEFYQITSVAWMTEPYQAEGVWYRKALAKGKKKVADLEAAYGGTVQLPVVPGVAAKAVYYPADATYTMKAVAKYRLQTVDFWDWLRQLLKNPAIIGAAVSLLLLILLAVVIIYLVAKKKRERKEQETESKNKKIE